MKLLGTGVYHCGVEVYDIEYSYGCNDSSGTGVFSNEPRENDCHHFKQTVEMGSTSMSNDEINRTISELEGEWLGRDYHILNHNCCDFSNELCKRLGVGMVPGWVKSAAGVGACAIDVPSKVAQFAGDVVHLRPVKNAISGGKDCRGATDSDPYRLGDFTLGAIQPVKNIVQERVNAGKQSRGGSEADSYKFGDFTLGAVSGISNVGKKILEEGARARDADSRNGYKFGDFTRGLVSNIARR